MTKLLVIRFSALGDVAMSIPVLWSIAMQYPDIQITILSRSAFRPLFEKLPANVAFYGADFKDKHKGLTGLWRLFGELKNMKFTGIADIHDVLRSKFLRFCFRIHGIPVIHIHKGRKEKYELTRKDNKIRQQLKTSFIRYAEVFQKLGFPADLSFTSIYGIGKGDLSTICNYTGEKGNLQWIGIAPFAKHQGKIYPLSLQEKIIAHFAKNPRIRIFLFGGGQNEIASLSEWSQKYSNIVSMAGKLNMQGELILMSHLDIMLSMDSANMHLASLVNTPVVSVWGATHPWCGFMGWHQLPENAIQTALSCRPCSIFGDKPCFRKDYACLNQIQPETIIQQIENLIGKNQK